MLGILGLRSSDEGEKQQTKKKQRNFMSKNKCNVNLKFTCFIFFRITILKFFFKNIYKLLNKSETLPQLKNKIKKQKL